LKILVTGGAGYIGGTVAQLLLDHGHQVVVYDNLCHAHRSMVPAKTEFIEGDLADRSRLEKILHKDIDGVMHFAALIEAGESMKNPEIYFRNNSASTLSLLESMLATGVNRLVFSSTAAVYGEPESTPIREDAALRPTNAYGESKLLVERMLEWLNRIHGFRYASLRYFNVAGAIDGRGEAHEPESHLIPLILDVALGRRASIKVFGQDYPTPDGTCIRDYIHVADLAEAHIAALDHLLRGGATEAFNVGTGRGQTVMEVMRAVEEVTGRKVPYVIAPRRAGDTAELVADSAKLRRTLGWKPMRSDLNQIVRDAWAFFQQSRP
jgi:UDP-glucose 4-epimerase